METLWLADYSRKIKAWQFYEESGRVRIVFLAETTGRLRGGWMRLDDLAKFTYDCDYDPAINPVPGYPFTPGIITTGTSVSRKHEMPS